MKFWKITVLVQRYLSNMASFVVYGITCLIRLVVFAELFTIVEEIVCYTSTLRQVIPPDSPEHRCLRVWYYVCILYYISVCIYIYIYIYIYLYTCIQHIYIYTYIYIYIHILLFFSQAPAPPASGGRPRPTRQPGPPRQCIAGIKIITKYNYY